ncbi:fumarate reductase/succinate dehydrogenase flavoprotein subunit [Leptospira borgpetersenii]|uniref:succinate dehydrogenase n=1 Tax=Leptospira borgpetersenii serovar Javanica str. UI 09931 TaxID=1049767 RepID=A0AAV3JAD1_LEPBO|nr:fumarate reductase/succinate dehydrogenase flavoprotein subunit [Leptospira borgpetersenii]AXX16121.1 fumarate reductase/succinate dehydrogenase flavoprotein subunit [Leptospira borgpetersenii serovar Ceylonica]EKQ90903.1 succinate dehydrogenase or fumarate reductase, flavoprotein subunit [Leptospira borgpetersenii str. UI 09149]EMN56734.1 succinate dehydrogenase or fumarate reductase, flavoprotein subunit [Leptospira borgpetersenii serovar Javanica str. MK146]EPG57133.1 succinate dehydrogen
MSLDSKIPNGPIEKKWSNHKANIKLVNPANKRKFNIIVVGSGLAGASASATLAELGYNVKTFCFQDSPRRAHSIAAQGGINAAKNYQNDGDSVYRLFYDTVKGGDFRAREANVHRLAEVSVNIIDQCVAQGVPFAREYGGHLSNRSFGGAQVSRTFYAKGQTGQQLLLGAYSALSRQIGLGAVKMYPRTEMVELIVIDSHAKGIIVRDLVTGELSTHMADAIVLGTGGYGNVFFLSTNAKGCNVTATWKAHKKGAYFANPCYTQIHPTCIPVSGDHQSKLTLMSESLRNDGRIWVPKNKGDKRSPADIPESERDYYLERKYPSYGNLSPRDIASRAAKEACDAGLGVGESGQGVYLDFADSIKRLGEDKIRDRYENLFQMYEQITGENPYKQPMRIYPAVHYTMGGLWVDYNLMSNLPGLFVIGEANFSDHGANRLGASALMQGLADGYFILPYTIGNYLAGVGFNSHPKEDHAEAKKALSDAKETTKKLLSIQGKRTVDSFHKQLGKLMWDKCGMARNDKGLKEALSEIPNIREEFWKNVNVPGSGAELNQSLEKAGRVADFLEFAELLCLDALTREESCGGHFREEHQEEGEAKRNDDKFCHATAWEFNGIGKKPTEHREKLEFENVHLATRSYK